MGADRTRRKLHDLKTLSEYSGVLHEAQLHQLRWWGILAFQHFNAADVELVVDPVAHKVTYQLHGKPRSRPKQQLSKVLASMVLSIHDLLGETWKLVVRQGEKVVLEGPCRSVTEWK